MWWNPLLFVDSGAAQTGCQDPQANTWLVKNTQKQIQLLVEMKWNEMLSESAVTDASTIQFTCKNQIEMINSTESTQG